MKRSTKHYLVLAAILSVLSVSVSADPLWDRVIDNASAGKTLLAGRVVMDIRQYNGRGRLTGSGSTVITREVSGEGSIKVSVEKSGDNPPDPDELLDNPMFNGIAGSGIFDPAIQPLLRIVRLPDLEFINGLPVVVFRYEMPTNDRGLVTGRIWIDRKDAIPLKLTSVPEDPKDPLDHSQSVITFGRSTGEHGEPYSWFPETMITEGSMSGIIQRKIEVVIRFSDYVRLSMGTGVTRYADSSRRDVSLEVSFNI